MLALSGKLSRKIVGMLFVFFLVALAATSMTLQLSRQLEGAAAAINDAGSQRMRTYRIAHLMSRSIEPRMESVDDSARLRAELQRFDAVLHDLRQGDPARPMAPPRDAEVEGDLAAVEKAWQGTMRPLVESFSAASPEERPAILDRFDAQLEGFVARINDLVLAMEHDYAENTRLLRTVQAALVVLALIGTWVLIRFFAHLVIRPVSELHAGIQRMSKGDFSVRVPVTRDDELGSLAGGFNEMAGRLQSVYMTLEQRVEAKTRSLAERNRELGVLYEITAFLGDPAPLESVSHGFIDRIKSAMGADAGAVRLYQADSEALFLVAHEGLPESFIDCEASVQLGDCICGEVVRSGLPVVFDMVSPPPGMKLQHCIDAGFVVASAFNIRYNKQQIGVFNLYFRVAREISAQEINLLETLGQHLGVAIENQRLRSREKELAVSEERNLLAQELHDSIAQGLAFLNLQVQLLQDSLRKGRGEEALQTAEQLREGVQESYDDVRELLVHFRTRVNDADLESAITSALEKFEGQTGIKTEFTSLGQGSLLEPSDEIQVMHIVQESLSNVRKHAHAKSVHVRLDRSPHQLCVEVADDGEGFDPINDPKVLSDRHVGLRIMRERAHRIGGEWRLESRPGGGTRVTLVLPGNRGEIAHRG